MECNAEKLLVLVEQRPAIYNFKLKEHSNRTIIDKLWEEIATEMGHSGKHLLHIFIYRFAYFCCHETDPLLKLKNSM